MRSKIECLILSGKKLSAVKYKTISFLCHHGRLNSLYYCILIFPWDDNNSTWDLQYILGVRSRIHWRCFVPVEKGRSVRNWRVWLVFFGVDEGWYSGSSSFCWTGSWQAEDPDLDIYRFWILFLITYILFIVIKEAMQPAWHAKDVVWMLSIIRSDWTIAK